jgi:hypothetical protein
MFFFFLYYLHILWQISSFFNVCLQVYRLPTDRLYATYFGGDKKLGLEEDLEARDIWRNFLPVEHVLPFGCKVSTSVDLLCHTYAGFGLSLPYMIC